MNASRKLSQWLTPDKTANATGSRRVGMLATVSRARLEAALLWFTFSISSIVWIEPAPFDFLCLILVGIWFSSGLIIPNPLRPLILMFIGLAATGLFAAFLSQEMFLSARHIIISIFLYFLTISIAAYVANDPERSLPAILNGLTVAALIAVAAGVAGYFTLFDGAYEIFTERDRARGTFKDPNVFGPFLVVPFVYIYLQHIAGHKRVGGVQTGILALLGLGLLLSFSRGAWANLVLSLATATYLVFVSSRSNTLRLRVLLLAIVAVVLVIAGLIFALSFESISSMMSVRGKLLQTYDTQERFAGAKIALSTILAHPLGIGATAFKHFHNAEPHNVYLYSFLIGGWLGGFLYIALVATTVVIGAKSALTHGSTRLVSIMLFSTFLATALEGLIVDTDHWRHFYFLMAGIWGVHSYQKTRGNIRPSRSAIGSSSEPNSKPTPIPPELPATLVERRRFVRRGPLTANSAAAPAVRVKQEEQQMTKQVSAELHKMQNRLPADFSLREEARRRRQEQSLASAKEVTFEPLAPRETFGLRSSDPDEVRESFGMRR